MLDDAKPEREQAARAIARDTGVQHARARGRRKQARLG
jgi:hypothetical protein